MERQPTRGTLRNTRRPRSMRSEYACVIGPNGWYEPTEYQRRADSLLQITSLTPKNLCRGMKGYIQWSLRRVLAHPFQGKRALSLPGDAIFSIVQRNTKRSHDII